MRIPETGRRTGACWRTGVLTAAKGGRADAAESGEGKDGGALRRKPEVEPMRFLFFAWMDGDKAWEGAWGASALCPQ